MTVKFNVVARSDPRDLEAPKKYYPSLKSSGRMKLRQMAEEMAEISTLSSIDMMAALEALLVIIPRELGKGNIVELGDLGSFWLRAQTTGAEAAADVTAQNIAQLLPLFKPGQEFKNTLKDVDFQKAGQ